MSFLIVLFKNRSFQFPIIVKLDVLAPDVFQMVGHLYFSLSAFSEKVDTDLRFCLFKGTLN